MVKPLIAVIRLAVTWVLQPSPLKRNLILKFRKERECKKMTKDTFT
jgi:hypothetical protein